MFDGPEFEMDELDWDFAVVLHHQKKQQQPEPDMPPLPRRLERAQARRQERHGIRYRLHQWLNSFTRR